MSEQKLKEILQLVTDGEMDIDEAFDEIGCNITFEDHYEGE